MTFDRTKLGRPHYRVVRPTKLAPRTRGYRIATAVNLGPILEGTALHRTNRGPRTRGYRTTTALNLALALESTALAPH